MTAIVIEHVKVSELPETCGFPSNPLNFYLENQSVTIYSYAVTKREKMLEKARNSPGGLSFNDFETLLEQSGWKLKRQTGSYRFWKAPKGPVVPIQPDRGKAKAYQVKQFLRIMGNGNE